VARIKQTHKVKVNGITLCILMAWQYNIWSSLRKPSAAIQIYAFHCPAHH
jgi:hypothetical protein